VGSEQATVTNKNSDENNMQCEQAGQEVTGLPQDMVLPWATTGDQPACDNDRDIQMTTSQTMEQPPKTIPPKRPLVRPPGQSSTCIQHNVHHSQNDIDDIIDDMEVDGKIRGTDTAGSSKRHIWWVCSENNKKGTGRPRCHECNELVEVGELRVRKTEHPGARVNHLKCVYGRMCAHEMLGNWQILREDTQHRVRRAYLECFATIAKANWDQEIPKHEVEPVWAPLINDLEPEQSKPLSAARSPQTPPVQPPGQSSTCLQHNVRQSQNDIDDIIDNVEVDGEIRGVDAAGSSKRHIWWVCSANKRKGTGRPKCHECRELVEVGELRVRKTEHPGARVNHLKCVYGKMCAHTMLGNWQMLAKDTQDRIRRAYVECSAIIAKADWNQEIPKHEVEQVCAPPVNLLDLAQSEPLSAVRSSKTPPAQLPGQSSTYLPHSIHHSQNSADDIVDDMEVDSEICGVDAAGSSKRHIWWVCSENNKKGTGRPKCHECNKLVEVGELRVRKTEHSGARVSHLKCVYGKICAHTMLGNWQMLTKDTQDRVRRAYKECFVIIAQAGWAQEPPKHEAKPVCAPLVKVLGLERSEPSSATKQLMKPPLQPPGPPPKMMPPKTLPAQQPGQISTRMQHCIHDSQSDRVDMIDDIQVSGEISGVDAAGSSKRHIWWVCRENNKKGTGRPRCHECNELVEVGELRVRKTEHSGARVNHLTCVYSKMCAHTMLGNWQTLTRGTQDRVRGVYAKCFATTARPTDTLTKERTVSESIQKGPRAQGQDLDTAIITNIA